LGLNIVRSDSGLGHTRERIDTFVFWWGYQGIIGEWWVVGLEGEEEDCVEGK